MWLTISLLVCLSCGLNEAMVFRGSAFNKNYFRNSQDLTYDEAHKACKLIGGSLAMIRSQEENDFIQKHVSHERRGQWIGGVKVFPISTFIWTTAPMVINYTNWYESQPDESSSCSGMTFFDSGFSGENKFWWDDPCTNVSASICEVRDPSGALTVHPGGHNATHLPIKTNLAEIQSKMVYRGSAFAKTYFRNSDDLGYDDAERACNKISGSLVKIRSPDENMFIRKYVSGTKGLSQWVGAVKTENMTSFNWTNAPKEIFLNYTYWYKTQPDDNSTDCVGMTFLDVRGRPELYGHKYRWENPCAMLFASICEVKDSSAPEPDRVMAKKQKNSDRCQDMATKSEVKVLMDRMDAMDRTMALLVATKHTG